ncbi:MAG TPA: hypothetical protein VFQ85_11710, partial [Mycobacteriales bacterium]|nr:hypothetical protein [Mycobacteriales bacterium]
MTATQTATPHVAPRRRRLSGPLLGAAAVAAVLLLVGGALAVRAATTGSEPGAFLDWAPRGSLAADDAAIGQVRRTWDDGVSFALGATAPATPVAPRHPHSDLRVLYAEQTRWGQLVLAEARSDTGQPE